MDLAVKTPEQRQSKLDKHREILMKKRQQKHAHQVLSLHEKSVNAFVDSHACSPRTVSKASGKKIATIPSNIEQFAYDGPQAYNLGNPDLLDPPLVQVLRINNEAGSSPLAEKTMSARTNAPPPPTPLRVPSRPISSSQVNVKRQPKTVMLTSPLHPVKLTLPNNSCDVDGNNSNDQQALFNCPDSDVIERDNCQGMRRCQKTQGARTDDRSNPGLSKAGNSHRTETIALTSHSPQSNSPDIEPIFVSPTSVFFDSAEPSQSVIALSPGPGLNKTHSSLLRQNELVANNQNVSNKSSRKANYGNGSANGIHQLLSAVMPNEEEEVEQAEQEYENLNNKRKEDTIVHVPTRLNSKVRLRSQEESRDKTHYSRMASFHAKSPISGGLVKVIAPRYILLEQMRCQQLQKQQQRHQLQSASRTNTRRSSRRNQEIVARSQVRKNAKPASTPLPNEKNKSPLPSVPVANPIPNPRNKKMEIEKSSKVLVDCVSRGASCLINETQQECSCDDDDDDDNIDAVISSCIQSSNDLQLVADDVTLVSISNCSAKTFTKNLEHKVCHDVDIQSKCARNGFRELDIHPSSDTKDVGAKVERQLPIKNLTVKANSLMDFSEILKFKPTSNTLGSNLKIPEITSCANTIIDPFIDPESFVRLPSPQGVKVRCQISRDKHGVDRGFFPTYFLHVQRDDGRKFFLLAARRRRRSTTSNYVISHDATDLSRASCRLAGKLRANFVGTHFTVYDCTRVHNNNETLLQTPLTSIKGDAPPSLSASTSASSTHSTSLSSLDNEPREIAAIIYNQNILGFKGPRKMTVLIPRLDDENHHLTGNGDNKSGALLDSWKKRKSKSLLELHNKTPVWNEETQSYVLNFHGRVTQASVKNFQIVRKHEEEKVIMQFGRISDDIFNMDFTYPMCALQAFGIALSSFDGKLACE